MISSLYDDPFYHWYIIDDIIYRWKTNKFGSSIKISEMLDRKIVDQVCEKCEISHNISFEKRVVVQYYAIKCRFIV
jgi:hypothetical protein